MAGSGVVSMAYSDGRLLVEFLRQILILKSSGLRNCIQIVAQLPILIRGKLKAGDFHTVRPGSNRLAGTGEGLPPPEPPDASDLVSDLRARDWITTDGTLTLVGRHALARWCRTADDPAPVTPAGETPHT